MVCLVFYSVFTVFQSIKRVYDDSEMIRKMFNVWLFYSVPCDVQLFCGIPPEPCSGRDLLWTDSAVGQPCQQEDPHTENPAVCSRPHCNSSLSLSLCLHLFPSFSLSSFSLIFLSLHISLTLLLSLFLSLSLPLYAIIELIVRSKLLKLNYLYL